MQTKDMLPFLYLWYKYDATVSIRENPDSVIRVFPFLILYLKKKNKYCIIKKEYINIYKN